MCPSLQLATEQIHSTTSLKRNNNRIMAAKMNPGTILSDDKGKDWTIRDEVGSGTWGHTLSVTNHAGEQFLLKVPYREQENNEGSPLPDSAPETFNAISTESAAIAERGKFGPRPVATISLESGGVGVVYQRHTTAQQLLDGGLGLAKIIDLALATCAKLASAPHLHGNLHPSNILIDGDSVLLADPLTDTHKAYYSHIRHWQQSPNACLPPESGAPHAGFDAWAICHFICLGITPRDEREDQQRMLAKEGLSRINAQTLQELLLTAATAQGFNPIFAPKAVKQLVRLLTRGLSKNASPSPPYRFQGIEALQQRLTEVSDFLNPEITGLGTIHLGASASQDTFLSDTPPSLSISIAVSEAVTYLEIQPGVRLVDLDSPAGERIQLEDLTYEVRQRVGDRIRYTFRLPLLNVARYRATLAFSLKSSGETPVTADIDFIIAATAGTLPPIIAEPTPFPTVIPSPTDVDPVFQHSVIPPAPPDSTPPSLDSHDPLPTPIAPATANVEMPDSSPHGAIDTNLPSTPSELSSLSDDDAPVTPHPAQFASESAPPKTAQDTEPPESFDEGPMFNTLPPVSQSGSPTSSPSMSTTPPDPIPPSKTFDNLSASFDDFEEFDNTAARIKDHVNGWMDSVKNDRVMGLMLSVISLLTFVLIYMGYSHLQD
jgi:hypothetical protein